MARESDGSKKQNKTKIQRKERQQIQPIKNNQTETQVTKKGDNGGQMKNGTGHSKFKTNNIKSKDIKHKPRILQTRKKQFLK